MQVNPNTTKGTLRGVQYSTTPAWRRFRRRASSSRAGTVGGLGLQPGWHCYRAAICADKGLRRQDGALSSLYGKLSRAQPLQRDSLRQAQLNWLKTRDSCGADTTCIQRQYEERIAATRAQLRDAVAYQPDSVDRLALEDLRQAVDAMRKTDPEFPLETVLKGMELYTSMTTFSNVARGKGRVRRGYFPKVRPAGVTKDEWRAMLESKIDAGGEHGTASYTLADLDGDGRRDLVLVSYMSGIGMFASTSVLRRDGRKFTGPYRGISGDLTRGAAGDPGDAIGREYLFLNDGRGAHQSNYWIRLRGRIYATTHVSYYGIENVYLLRPLTLVGEAPKLAIRYRYQFSVPTMQEDVGKGTTTTLDHALHAALTQAVGLVRKERAYDLGKQEKPLCPIPDTVADDERGVYDSYGTYGPGPHMYEVVGDMPVWLERQCDIGQLLIWFGGYSAERKLVGQLWVRKAGDAHSEKQTYAVKGVRTVIGVEASMAKVDDDGGAADD